DLTEVVGPDSPDHRRQARAQRERDQLRIRHPLPEAARAVLVVSNGKEGEPELAPARPPAHPEREHEQREYCVVEGALEGRVRERRQWQQDPLRAVRQRMEIEGELLYDEEQRQSHDREGRPPRPE